MDINEPDIVDGLKLCIVEDLSKTRFFEEVVFEKQDVTAIDFRSVDNNLYYSFLDQLVGQTSREDQSQQRQEC